jgi:predicted transcriptional regulator
MRKSTNKFEIVGDILKITAANGTLILADANEYDLLRKYSWCISRTGYAVANINYKVVKKKYA